MSGKCANFWEIQFASKNTSHLCWSIDSAAAIALTKAMETFWEIELNGKRFRCMFNICFGFSLIDLFVNSNYPSVFAVFDWFGRSNQMWTAKLV